LRSVVCSSDLLVFFQEEAGFGNVNLIEVQPGALPS